MPKVEEEMMMTLAACAASARPAALFQSSSSPVTKLEDFSPPSVFLGQNKSIDGSPQPVFSRSLTALLTLHLCCLGLFKGLMRGLKIRSFYFPRRELPSLLLPTHFTHRCLFSLLEAAFQYVAINCFLNDWSQITNYVIALQSHYLNWCLSQTYPLAQINAIKTTVKYTALMKYRSHFGFSSVLNFEDNFKTFNL